MHFDTSDFFPSTILEMVERSEMNEEVIEIGSVERQRSAMGQLGALVQEHLSWFQVDFMLVSCKTKS